MILLIEHSSLPASLRNRVNDMIRWLYLFAVAIGDDADSAFEHRFSLFLLSLAGAG